MLGFCSLASPSYVLTSPPTILPHAQRLSLLRREVVAAEKAAAEAEAAEKAAKKAAAAAAKV